MIYLWSTTLFVGITLQVLVIAALLKGPYRDFWLLFVYAVTLFLTTVVEAAAFFNTEIWARTSQYYWVNDTLRQILIFSLVIALTYRAMGASPRRSAVGRMLGGGVILVTLLSLYLSRTDEFWRWMATVGRNLGFCAVILNLVLWAVLIKHQHTDRRLLLITGGLGIQMAGKAIGHSLRQISSSTVLAGELIIVLSHLLCLYIWWQALRSFDRQEVERYNKVEN
jgi:hypothetical protein